MTAGPKKRRWSQGEYHRLADEGFFRGQRIQLIGGEILQFAPQRDIHFATLSLAGDALKAAFGEGYWVRLQGPLDFGDDSEPEPDVSVVKGVSRDYIGTGHPASAMLVVEISDTTLRYDRREKAGLYARHGIADYWIVNLVENQLEIHRDPAPDDRAPFGWRYQTNTILHRGKTAAPLALPHARVAVKDMLP